MSLSPIDIWGAECHLTHLLLVLHIWSMNRESICSDNGLSPIRRQAIILTNADLLSIWSLLGTNFSDTLIKIQNFSFTKMHLKVSSAKGRPFCPGGGGGVNMTRYGQWQAHPNRFNCGPNGSSPLYYHHIRSFKEVDVDEARGYQLRYHRKHATTCQGHASFIMYSLSGV